eukprot:5852661-Amphidinium_carterae.1
MEESLRGRHYHPTTTTGKERMDSKGKGDKNIDIQLEATSVGGTKEDRSTIWINLRQCGHAQNLQPSSQTATTTILTQPQQQQPPSITLYDQQQYVRAFTGATLVVDKETTTTDQLQRWAILIDTGAITS